MYTTIKVSDTLKKMLENMKMSGSESYEDVIEDLLEDRMHLNEKTLAEIEESRKQVKAGRSITLEEVKKRLKRDV